MTEKRFDYCPFDGFEDNGEYITHYEVVDRLNELNDKNEQLKGLLKDLKEKYDFEIAEEWLK